MKPYVIAFVAGGGLSIIASAAVRALPEPLPMGSRFYLFIYRFAQNLLANFDKAQATKPQQQ